jgi:hypothetical protein
LIFVAPMALMSLTAASTRKTMIMRCAILGTLVARRKKK